MNVVEIIQAAWKRVGVELGGVTVGDTTTFGRGELTYKFLPARSLVLTEEDVPGSGNYVALVYTSQTTPPPLGVKGRVTRNQEPFLFDVRVNQDYLLAREAMERLRMALQGLPSPVLAGAPGGDADDVDPDSPKTATGEGLDIMPTTGLLTCATGNARDWAGQPDDYGLEVLAITGQLFGERRVATATIRGTVY